MPTTITAQAAHPPTQTQTQVSTFRDFAGEWWDLHTAHLAPNTIIDYRWRLNGHLLNWFGDIPINQISARAVDEYKVTKLRDGRLCARSINMTLSLLCSILEEAVELELLNTNPARGRRRRLPPKPPQRTCLETAEQIQALLDAAHQLDQEARPYASHIPRRAVIATLVFSGLRISELCALRWGDIDFDANWIFVRKSKTPAGVRQVRLRPALRKELKSLAANARGPDDAVFATRSGANPRPANLRVRVVQRAAALATSEMPSFPAGITPHSLRRTFASILFAIGEPHPVVMVEMGHTNPGMTLGVYAQAMRRDDGERSALNNLLNDLGPPRPPARRHTVRTGPAA